MSKAMVVVENNSVVDTADQMFSFNGNMVQLSIIGFVCPVCLGVVKYSLQIQTVGPDYPESGLKKLEILRVWRTADSKLGVDTKIPTLTMGHDIKVGRNTIKKTHEVLLAVGDELKYVKTKSSFRAPNDHPLLVAKIVEKSTVTWVYKGKNTQFIFKPESYRFNPNPCKYCWYTASDSGITDPWGLIPITYPDWSGSLGLEMPDETLFEMKYDPNKKNWFIIHVYNSDNHRDDGSSIELFSPLDENHDPVLEAGCIAFDEDPNDFTHKCLK